MPSRSEGRVRCPRPEGPRRALSRCDLFLGRNLFWGRRPLVTSLCPLSSLPPIRVAPVAVAVVIACPPLCPRRCRRRDCPRCSLCRHRDCPLCAPRVPHHCPFPSS